MSSLMDTCVRRTLRRAAFTASLGSLALSAYPSVAHAAEEELQELEEVQVTGSRIVRRDYEAHSPIVTVDETLLRNSSTAAIETQLAKLQQFRPVQTPTRHARRGRWGVSASTTTRWAVPSG